MSSSGEKDAHKIFSLPLRKISDFLVFLKKESTDCGLSFGKETRSKGSADGGYGFFGREYCEIMLNLHN
jgi:hypothetical protein